MAAPEADHAAGVVGCYRKPESRLSYRLLLGGTKHFGYYPEGSGGLSMAEAMRLMEDRLGLALDLPPVRGCWMPAAARATWRSACGPASAWRSTGSTCSSPTSGGPGARRPGSG